MTTFSADLAKFLVGLRTENMPPEVVQTQGAPVVALPSPSAAP